MKSKIIDYLNKSIKTKQSILDKQTDVIENIVKAIVDCLKNNNKILIFGNGGSAADAQHMSAELVGRFEMEREPLPVIALTINTSILTAVANDYGYDEVFTRQLKAFAKKGDIAIGITTSGSSKNVVKAIELATQMNVTTIAFTGGAGSPINDLADISFVAESDYTPVIQEAHITVIHIICKLVEEELFGNV